MEKNSYFAKNNPARRMITAAVLILLLLLIAGASVHAVFAADADSASPADASSWTTDDFTYGDYEKLLYGCDYSRQFTVSGKVITGFSGQGQEKLKTNKDLVIPAKGPDGKNIVGIGPDAFKEKGLRSVKFPTGMMTRYNDTLAESEEDRVTRRGNFIICEGAFRKNELTEVTLPAGVIAVLPNAFQSNQIRTVKLPRTLWWIETCAFFGNEISRVDFPETTDFMLEMHGMPFAKNRIKSVRLPDSTEVVNKDVFALNPGMEPLPKQDPWGNKVRYSDDSSYGIVHMYTDNKGLMAKLQKRIHSVDGKNANIYSPYQKLIVSGSGTSADPDEAKWKPEDFTCDGGKITGLSKSGIRKRKTNPDLVIPSKTPDGTTVTEIGSTDSDYGLFASEDEKIDSVYMPNTIRKIGDRAFYNSGIRDITFSNDLESIGMLSFSTNELTSVVLPDSVEELGKGAFSTNAKLERIVLSDGLTEIPDAAFGCSDAKHYMTNLTEIEIPGGITKIGARAFAGNNFHEIEIPKSVTEIGEYAFSTKNYLKDPCTLTLHEGLKKIGDNAFRNKVIEQVELPESVESLPKNVFRREYTQSGQTVHDGNAVKVLMTSESQYRDDEKFPDSEYQHKYLTKASVWTAGDFEYTIQNEKVLITGLSDFGKKKLEKNRKLTIPEKDTDGSYINGIADGAFDGASSETKISALKLPEHRNKDEAGAFTIGERAFADNALTSLDIPEGVTEIGKEAFRGNALTSVSFSTTVQYIRQSAFESNRLKDVVFGSYTASPLQIESRAFADNKIKFLELPPDTEVLKGDAFAENTGKKNGVVYVLIPNASGSALEDTTNGKSSVQKILTDEADADPADMPWSARHFTYNEAGTVITGLSSDGQAKIKSDPDLVIPSRIGGMKVTGIGEGKESIGTFGFTAEDGTKYTPSSVTLPEDLEWVGDYAFDGNSLAEIDLPQSARTIGKFAFRDNRLTSVSLPDSVTELGEGAFAASKTENASITEMKLPGGLTEPQLPDFRMTAKQKFRKTRI